jgi:NADPH:quinone reductase-like Zn-dependent oxidoreductase
MRQVWISRAGAPEVLEVREAPDPTPGPGQVRVRVVAAGINFADIMARMGMYPDLPGIPYVVGYEVSGHVEAVGEGVDASRVGDAVVCVTRFGGYSDVVVVDADQAFPLPSTVDLVDAAAIPVIYLTAWQLLVSMGGLKADESVLIHSAGGGVGIAAVQLAKHIGATIIGTASPGKHAGLRERGVDHCIDYRSEDFHARVMEITGGRGVELVIDAVGGDSFSKSYASLAPTGRLGMFGMSTAVAGTRRTLKGVLSFVFGTPWFKFNPARLMNENKGVFGVNMGHMWDEKHRIIGWMNEILALVESGVLVPPVDRTFSFEHAADAHQYIQDRKNVGKVLLTP